MSKFKVGDRVKVKDGHYQGHPFGSPYNLPREAGVVEAYCRDRSITVRYGEVVSPPVNGESFCLVDHSPVRIVTRKEVVGGRYSRLGTLEISPNGVNNRSVSVSLEARFYTKSDLREIAELIATTADALDEVA